MSKKTVSRRGFFRSGAKAAMACWAFPALVSSSALGRAGHTPPSDRIGMGFIGMGTMGDGHLFGKSWTYLPGGYIGRQDVQVLAVCDVWRKKREEGCEKVNAFYAAKAGTGTFDGCKAYGDFRELLAREDVDAVLIATPNHWHATMSVLAARAGKDVYCEKPTACTVRESQVMVKTFLATGKVFQAGTQQRSEYGGRFRTACELVRRKKLGTLKDVYAFRDGGGIIWPSEMKPAVPVPDGFNWDLWLGPAPAIPYQGDSNSHLFGFGGINWGQHHYDFVQWALDADRTGPIGLDTENGTAVYRYGSGVVVHGRQLPGETISETGGAWFLGTEGRLGVDREHLVAEPRTILDALLDPAGAGLYLSNSHSGNFLDCVKSRKKTICDIETAHRAVSVLLLGGIAKQLNRPLTWDPVKETFVGDEEANRLLSIEKRAPWKIED